MNSQGEHGINFFTLRKLIFLELEVMQKHLDGVIQSSKQHSSYENPEIESLLESIRKLEKETDSGLKFSFTSIHSGPQVIYHSTFISIYSFFEYSLKVIAQLIAYQDSVSKRKVNNMEKTYQYFYFLTEHLNIDRSQLEEEWRSLNIYKDIRNSIVHHNSTLGKNISTQSEEFVATYKGIELKDTGLFYFKDEQILIDLMKTGKRFLEKLMDVIETAKK